MLSISTKDTVFDAHSRSIVLFGNDIWARKADIVRLEWNGVSMNHWISGVAVKDRKPLEKLIGSH